MAGPGPLWALGQSRAMGSQAWDSECMPVDDLLAEGLGTNSRQVVTAVASAGAVPGPGVKVEWAAPEH
jgi:hypothetical protein